MTGYGRVVKRIRNRSFTIEVKSLNSKGLDLNVRLPSFYRDKEIDLRNLVSTKLKRGKIDIYINVENTATSSNHGINKELAKSYYKNLKALSKEVKEEGVDIFPLVLRMPNVIVPEREDGSEQEWVQILKGVRDCLDKLDKFRLQEGKAMEKDLITSISRIEKQLVQIGSMEKGRIKRVKEKLLNNLKKFTENNKLNQDRFEQELIYYLEKFDISEEKSRLTNHCKYFKSEMKNSVVDKGKKIGFICQEIGREINTIGSKANDANIQKLVIQMKDELEKVKEQVSNAL